jgi:hypothetical protein
MAAIIAASMVAFAQPPATPKTAPVKPVKQEKVQIITLLTPFQTLKVSQPVSQNKIQRVEGMSSRPWTQIVGWKPGYPAFPSPEMHESTLCLFSVGNEPER